MLVLGDPGSDLFRQFAEGKAYEAEHPVLPRWERVRHLQSQTTQASTVVKVDAAALRERKAQAASWLVHAIPLVTSSVPELRARHCAVVLADADGVLLESYGAELVGEAKEGLQEGACWDETLRGTNGIGTALAEGQPVSVVGKAHYDPRAHQLACYAAPIRDPQGQLLGALDLSTPLSRADPLFGVVAQSLVTAIEGALRTQTLRQLSSSLASTLRSNETFLAAVGHDLRDPLSAITFQADLMRKRAVDLSQLRAAELIRTSGRRMARMVEDLLDLARVRLGQGLLVSPRDRLDLATVVGGVVSEQGATRPGRPIEVLKRGDTVGSWDEARMGQLLSNLIGNAVRHGREGAAVQVEIDGFQPDLVTLCVTNSGEIGADVQAELFEPFHPSRPIAGTPQGLGLGLFIVEQIVRAHQGKLDLLPQRGKTTFRVTLPRFLTSVHPVVSAPDDLRTSLR